MKLVIGRSIETAITFCSAYIGAFISLYVRSLNSELTESIIYATI